MLLTLRRPDQRETSPLSVAGHRLMGGLAQSPEGWAACTERHYRKWWADRHRSRIIWRLRNGPTALPTKKLRREPYAMQEIDESRVAAQRVKSRINV